MLLRKLAARTQIQSIQKVNQKCKRDKYDIKGESIQYHKTKTQPLQPKQFHQLRTASKSLFGNRMLTSICQHEFFFLECLTAEFELSLDYIR
jgi:hypothetical protein